MKNKDILLKGLNKTEDRLLASKVLDKASMAEKSSKSVYTDFMDPYQRSIIEKVLSDSKCFDYTINGGYSGAERTVVVFSPYFISDKDNQDENIFKLLHMSAGRDQNLSHRDYLGSLMGLGIKREKIGDILIEKESSKVIVLNELSDYICFNLQKVGNTKIKVELVDFANLETSGPEFKGINSTVASMRLDCIASACLGLSRNDISDLIKSEKVSLNWVVTQSLSKEVKEGDTLSIRGKGRIILEKIGYTTKKGRISIVARKYI